LRTPVSLQIPFVSVPSVTRWCQLAAQFETDLPTRCFSTSFVFFVPFVVQILSIAWEARRVHPARFL